jgi:sporulation protein YlmC with PRC-barrel domain
MSHARESETVCAQRLVGRAVRDARGKKVGRVYDLIAEREGDHLCVSGLLVGAGSWLSRFGWTKKLHGRQIPWEQIDQLSPDIRLRDGAKRGE